MAATASREDLPHEPGAHPYWRCDAAAAAARRDLPADTRALAVVFDGRRDARARLDTARERLGTRIDAVALHEAAVDLALAGLLEPGRFEALPAPAQLETDPWGGQLGHGFERAVIPPSMVPGTLAVPGLPGAIAGVGAGRRGSANQLRTTVNPEWFAPLGRVFAAPALHPLLGWSIVALVIGGLFALWSHHFEVARDIVRIRSFYRLLILAACASVCINLVAQSARLVAIRHGTGRWPRIGFALIAGFLPRLLTDTAGPAEEAGKQARGRILLAPLTAVLLLALIGQFGWFLSRQGPTVLPSFFLVLATASIVVFLFGANPLARRDGYHWIAHRLDTPDLRDQAWMLLAGWNRPWYDRPLPSRRARYTYAGLTLAYLFATVVLYLLFPAQWLERQYGGPGVLIFLTAMGFAAYRMSQRAMSSRASLEPFRVKMPKFSRTTWIVLGVLLVLFCLPYPYEPSGKAVVLPRDRAEVTALVAGDVREVLVQEGDMVEAGQELVRISDVQTKAQVAAAEATLKRAQSELAIVKTGGASEEVQLARQKVGTARERLSFAQAEADRLASAYKRKAVSVQDYDTARGVAAVRRQELAEAEQQLKLVGNPAREERIASLESEVVKAQTELDYHKEQLANTRIRAPIAGRVVSPELLFARGKYLAVGDLLARIEDTGQLQAELQMPESTVGDLAVDARAWLRVWTYPGTSFPGKVVHIAPDAEEGEYGKIVRVRVLLEDPGHQLKPEMTGQAKVRSHWTLAGIAFTRAFVRFLLVEVWSWLP